MAAGGRDQSGGCGRIRRRRGSNRCGHGPLNPAMQPWDSRVSSTRGASRRRWTLGLHRHQAGTLALAGRPALRARFPCGRRRCPPWFSAASIGPMWRPAIRPSAVMKKVSRQAGRAVARRMPLSFADGRIVDLELAQEGAGVAAGVLHVDPEEEDAPLPIGLPTALQKVCLLLTGAHHEAQRFSTTGAPRSSCRASRPSVRALSRSLPALP